METTSSQQRLTADEIENQARSKGKLTFGIYNIADIETKKFWIMFSAFTLMGLIYSIAREIKDAFVIERQDPSSIQFLKVFGILPAAGFVAAFISNLLMTKTNLTILKGFIIAFVIYFALFGLVLLPLRTFIEGNILTTIDLFADMKMKFFSIHYILGPFMSFWSWTSTINFIASEIWGTSVFILLFMSVANDVCPFNQFARFVPLFYIGSNIGLFTSGLICFEFTRLTQSCSFIFKERLTMGLIFALSVICGIVLALVFALEKYLLNDPYPAEKGETKSKIKMSVMESLKVIGSTPLCLFICITVLGYNISTNIIEACYKAAIARYADVLNVPRGEIVMRYNSILQISTGLFVIFLLCTPFKKSVQSIGWKLTGLITPSIAIISSVFVFCLATYNSYKAKTTPPMVTRIMATIPLPGSENLLFEVWIGLCSVAALKITKYAAFDIAKELFSMKIPKEYRARYKGVYDGVCGKFGKAGGSLYSLLALAIFQVEDCRAAGAFGIFFSLFICFFWVKSVIYLAGKYNDALKRNGYIEIE
ncbi:ADP,ATP carrier protein 1 [Cucumispora dikerogammari]|nr:ADP,ATP carrier protein 1 [Cucumispora dikerogammari]